MNRVFIRLSIIIFLDRMSTLSRDSDSNHVGACQFCNLSYGKSLIRKGSTIQTNNYLTKFSLYPSNYFYLHFMLKTIKSSSTYSCSIYHIIDTIYIAALKILSICAVVLIQIIEHWLKGMDKSTYNWIHNDYPHHFSRRHKSHQHMERKFI